MHKRNKLTPLPPPLSLFPNSIIHQRITHLGNKSLPPTPPLSLFPNPQINLSLMHKRNKLPRNSLLYIDLFLIYFIPIIIIGLGNKLVYVWLVPQRKKNVLHFETKWNKYSHFMANNLCMSEKFCTFARILEVSI